MKRLAFAGGTFAGGTVAALGIGRARSEAAQFTYKFHHDLPVESPFNVRMVQMWQSVERETGGRLKVTVFPNSTLGGDPAALNQLQSGALEFMAAPDGATSALVPVTAIMSVAFAWRSIPNAIAACDGKLGAYVRSEIDAKGLTVISPHVFINGLRQISTSGKPVKTASDLAGLRIGVIPSKLFLDLFKSLGASPTPVARPEVYVAMQTHLIDGADYPIAQDETFHFYEVQKYLSLTNHSWSGFYLVANPGAWNALPPDIRATVTRNAAKYAPLQQRDIINLESSLLDKLKRQGMVVNQADVASFRALLGPFYARWKTEFGPTAWGLLEQYSENLRHT